MPIAMPTTISVYADSSKVFLCSELFTTMPLTIMLFFLQYAILSQFLYVDCLYLKFSSVKYFHQILPYNATIILVTSQSAYCSTCRRIQTFQRFMFNTLSCHLPSIRSRCHKRFGVALDWRSGSC